MAFRKGLVAVKSISFGSPRARCTPMGRTCGGPSGFIQKITLVRFNSPLCARYGPEVVVGKSFFMSWLGAWETWLNFDTKRGPDGGTRREPLNLTPMGGQFDFVWLSARTMHPHGAYVW